MSVATANYSPSAEFKMNASTAGARTKNEKITGVLTENYGSFASTLVEGGGMKHVS
jgi:hypothetical protein